ncbi:DnaJ C-terminal domain-containing protein, partial [Anaerotignum sp.]
GDIFGSMFGGGFGGFGGFGGGSARRNGPRKGRDVNVNIQLTFEEAVFGCKKEISVAIYDECDTCHGTGAKEGTHAESCPTCNGTGQERVVQQSMFGAVTSVRTCSKCGGTGKVIKDPCNTCKGTGKVRKTKKYEVNVPKGIDNGQTIRLAGKGEIGENGGGYGDLLVTVYVQPNRVFVRKGYDIYCDVPITFVQAALGGDIIIKTIDGEQKYTIKPGTQPDTVVTLKGVGVPNLRNPKVRGNQIVTLKVKIPTELSEKQKDLLRQFYGDTTSSEPVEPEPSKEEKKSFTEKMKDGFKDLFD